MPEDDLSAIGALRVRLNRLEAQLGEAQHAIVALRSRMTIIEGRAALGPRGRAVSVESTEAVERAAAPESTESEERAGMSESTAKSERD